jgi:glycosyltransferase involved in cell wall biosynthesis
VLALEPYYGGSHRAVLDGLVEHVDADWTLLTLPARKWKWRMRGAAITIAQEVASIAETGARAPFDLIFASTFLNLAEFRGLVGTRTAGVPAIVYFHENQLVYPNRHAAEWDFQFPLTNITTALSAEHCLFNTRWNLERFLGEIPRFMREFPDHQPKGLAELIAAKSAVLPPPFDATVFDATAPHRGSRCRFVWPHRWEHDKNPEQFFGAVAQLAGEGLDFEVVVAGQSFRETEQGMREASEALGSRLVHCDEPATRAEYAALLASADVAVSTALNEFFGIAMIEACYAGCTPLVPDRLAYPELYPSEFRFANSDELVARMRGHIMSRPKVGEARPIAQKFTLGHLAPRYRGVFAEVASGSGA